MADNETIDPVVPPTKRVRWDKTVHKKGWSLHLEGHSFYLALLGEVEPGYDPSLTPVGREQMEQVTQLLPELPAVICGGYERASREAFEMVLGSDLRLRRRRMEFGRDYAFGLPNTPPHFNPAELQGLREDMNRRLRVMRDPHTLIILQSQRFAAFFSDKGPRVVIHPGRCYQLKFGPGGRPEVEWLPPRTKDGKVDLPSIRNK